MGQDEPKRAIRSFKEPFQNLKKPKVLMVLGPEASQESLKMPNKAPKRPPKISQKTKNAKIMGAW